MEGRMFRTITAASVGIVVGLTLLLPISHGNAEEKAPSRSGSWPIWNWHNHQPRADAVHTDDLTPQDARKVEQLYWQLEGQSPDGSDHCDARPIPPRERDQCRAEIGARVLPSRPIPVIMAPPH
jgi:hypothetical protein